MPGRWGGGYSWKFLVWLGDLAFGLKAEILPSLLRLERKQKHFQKSISNWHMSLSFLLIWNWSDKYFDTLP